MATLSVIREDVLTPVSAAHPAGDDLSVTSEWAAIRSRRPNVWDTGNRREWEPAEPHAAGWTLLRDMAADALATKSKDLRLAIWLLESSVRLCGFAGVRDGLCVIRELLIQFWDLGLHPLVEDGDLDARSGPLDWLNEKLADAILEIPLTLRPAPAVNYSLKYFRESRRPGGLITAQEFDAAAAAASRAEYETLHEELETAWRELAELERVCERVFPPEGISVVETKDAFIECRRVLDSIMRARPPAAGQPTAGDRAGRDPAPPPASVSLPGDGCPAADFDTAWVAAERLARSGDIDRALLQMTSLANVETNGRVRFHRKLLLAEICLNTRRTRLGKAILEELAELIDKHNLEQWETTEMVSAVWTRLYRCYTDETAGTVDAERAAKLFDRLCRLNPWQALACGDGR
ncbi:MAG TPA: type VI secretion system ImpA family N-terminal domain-containing protein [Bryobacteraceae bacterium]|nr:type VI secretion system ImpA family N-terminal domain-containing protein [Bryobacteraceae bacterium]